MIKLKFILKGLCSVRCVEQVIVINVHQCLTSNDIGKLLYKYGNFCTYKSIQNLDCKKIPYLDFTVSGYSSL